MFKTANKISTPIMFRFLIAFCVFLTIASCQEPNKSLDNFQLITQKRGKVIFNSPPSDAIPRIYLYETCQEAGGEVSMFHNGCANYCEALEMPTMPVCTMALTKSCKCGENQCYDRYVNKCRPIRR